MLTLGLLRYVLFASTCVNLGLLRYVLFASTCVNPWLIEVCVVREHLC